MASIKVEPVQADHLASPFLWKHDVTEECRHEATKEKSALLPSGFPSSLESEMAWTGTDLADESRYMYNLNENEKLEIDAALARFKGKGRKTPKSTLVKSNTPQSTNLTATRSVVKTFPCPLSSMFLTKSVFKFTTRKDFPSCVASIFQNTPSPIVLLSF
jgi:hypothetical protein